MPQYHRLQNNPQHCEEETQNTDSYNMIKVKQPALSSPERWKDTKHHITMGESSKIPKSWTLENQNLKLAVCLQIIKKCKFNGQIPLDKLKLHVNQKSYYYLQNSAFWGWLSMESQPPNHEFRNNLENFHPCITKQGPNKPKRLTYNGTKQQ